MTGGRHLLWRWWDRFWFAPDAPRNLAAARIVFALHALWILLSRDLPAISGLPVEFWAQVPPGTRWRYLLFPGHLRLEYVLYALAVAALLALLLGVVPRLTGLLAGLLLYHLAPLETIIWSASPYERGFEVSILALITLAFSPCADAWSVAARARRLESPRPAWEYHWPLRLLQLFVAQIYLFSGYSKLFRVGWDWASAENMRNLLLVFNQNDQFGVFKTLGPWIADRPVLCWLVGVGAIALDLGFIAVLCWKRARRVLVSLVLAFHAGILLSLNVVFLNAPQLLVFVDWEAWLRRLRGGRSLPSGGWCC